MPVVLPIVHPAVGRRFNFRPYDPRVIKPQGVPMQRKFLAPCRGPSLHRISRAVPGPARRGRLGATVSSPARPRSRENPGPPAQPRTAARNVNPLMNADGQRCRHKLRDPPLFMGQQEGGLGDDYLRALRENHRMDSALVKDYNINAKTPDSAPTRRRDRTRASSSAINLDQPRRRTRINRGLQPTEARHTSP